MNKLMEKAMVSKWVKERLWGMLNLLTDNRFRTRRLLLFQCSLLDYNSSKGLLRRIRLWEMGTVKVMMCLYNK